MDKNDSYTYGNVDNLSNHNWSNHDYNSDSLGVFNGLTHLSK
jgi:hypothetical protein